jgi:hypothetical protein
MYVISSLKRLRALGGCSFITVVNLTKLNIGTHSNGIVTFWVNVPGRVFWRHLTPYGAHEPLTRGLVAPVTLVPDSKAFGTESMVISS